MYSAGFIIRSLMTSAIFAARRHAFAAFAMATLLPVTLMYCAQTAESIIISVIGVSRPLVPDYGTTFHLDYGGRDLPLTLLKSL